ncbi:MAG: hypothetical protein Q8O19_04895, partial [Rectinemataceae bacterium]|nr:hypothetical protein [Rectinemataceae bacterium]
MNRILSLLICVLTLFVVLPTIANADGSPPKSPFPRFFWKYPISVAAPTDNYIWKFDAADSTWKLEPDITSISSSIWDTTTAFPYRDTIWVISGITGGDGTDTLIGFRRIPNTDTTEFFNDAASVSVFKFPFMINVVNHIRTATLRVGMLATNPATDTTVQFGATGSKAYIFIGTVANADSLVATVGNVKRRIPSYDTLIGTGGIVDFDSTVLQAGTNITFSKIGPDTLRITGAAGGSGTSDSVRVDTSGAGTNYATLYSTTGAVATVREGAGIDLTATEDTMRIAATLGTSVTLTTEVTGTLPVGNGGT